MKKMLLLLLAFGGFMAQAQTPCNNGNAGGFPCNGLTLQGKLSIAQMAGTSYGGNDPAEAQDSWGWTDPLTNREYALVGMNDQTAFVDITNPNSPKPLGRLKSTSGSSTSWWRDVKTYGNYAFIVSDNNGNHGMQVFDLTKLRGLSTSATRTFTEDNHLTWGNGQSRGKAHNLIINEDSGWLYILGASTNSGGPLMVNIQNPLANLSFTTLSGYGYCHDAQVVMYDGPDPDHQGKEILIGAFSGNNRVYTFDVTNKNNPIRLGSVTYTNQAYTHQGWFTRDKKYFIAGDEVDEENRGFNTRTLVFNLTDLDNPSLHYTYYGATKAIDHNGYVVGNRFYLANYNAGIRVLRVDGLYDSPPSMEEVASFDTHPATNDATFHGAWNVYPFFKSGNIVVSDLDEGLIIVREPGFDNEDPKAICQNYTATLNKTTGNVTVTADDLDNFSTDNKGIVSSKIDGQNYFTCEDVGKTFNITLTVKDDYGYTASCVTAVTVAAAPTTYNGSNWSNGTPSEGSKAIINGNYNTATKGNINACECEVNTGRTLTVAADDFVNVEGNITVSGNLVVKHQGSIVQKLPTATVTNNGNINVEYTTPLMLPRVFLVMGSPMSGDTRTGAFGNSYMFLNHLTENFLPNPEVATQFPLAENFADDNYDNWVRYTGNINPTEGYIARPQTSGTDGNKTYNMTFNGGTLNSGNLNFAVKYNGNKNSSPNVLANPYASAIDARDFILENSMVNEVFFWNPLTPPSPLLPGAYTMNFSMQDISMYNLTGGTAAASDVTGTATAPNGFISTGEGFGIKATAAGTATFKNTMRETGNNNTGARPSSSDMDRMWISVENDAYKMQNTTLIGFTEAATANTDDGYDSKRLATVVSLYTHLEDGTEEFGIQSREAFKDGIIVPMGFSTLLDEELEYKISIKNFEGERISTAKVFLVDNQLKTITELTKESYSFTAAKGTFDGRFTLQFVGEEILGPIDTALANIGIYPNPTANVLNIISPQVLVENIEIIDVSGRVLQTTDAINSTSYQLDLTSLQSAIYFVKINTNLGAITKQIIKK